MTKGGEIKMANYIIRNGELRHYGILGMKWGVRRYQNPDGTLTAAGRKRYGSEEERNDAKQKRKEKFDQAFEPTIKTGKDKPNITPAEKIARDTGRAAEEASKVVNAASNIKNRKKGTQKIDLSHMSDQELRSVINRLELEQRYIKVTTPEKTSKGKAYADDILDIVGGIAGIAGSAMGIIAIVKKLT